jgi:conjugal transfer mating pair stabilization protein TraG
MSSGITIHVLGFAGLYEILLNATATFMKQDGFASLLRLTALIGIIMATVGFLKQRDPLVYAKWVLAYVLVLQVVILPKTTVAIYDISSQETRVVSHVPVVFAITASLITTVGVGLAESFDMLLSLPDDLAYTKTGSLFGSKIIQASRDFRIIDSQLKEEMNVYLRNCVVGDIRLNQKYSMDDLSQSESIWSLFSKQPSPIRMMTMKVDKHDKKMSCVEATSRLKAKLDVEIKNAYTFFGINLFGHSKISYEALFNTHLRSAFDYYQHMTDTASDIFLQSMMINAIGDGIKDYQAFTNSTAGVVNNQVTKSEVQHRWAWAISGQKAAWFLPILYTVLSVLMFGLFPVIIVMTTLPNGMRIFWGYVQFFVSLQFWPILFAMLNLVMMWAGQQTLSNYEGVTLVNIDKIDEIHSDLSGVAGYLMLMIPFIAKGLVSSFSEAFSGLATSMTGHLQGSAMSVANDAASGSFSLGQTSFYNSSANNLSANKHDTNWTNMHGMRTEQLATGVTKTRTGSGDTVFDVSPGMTKSAVSMSSNKGITGSLNEAAEASKQVSLAEHESIQTSLSNASHKAILLSQLDGHDMRLGDGVSRSETGEYQASLSKMKQIATDVAHRTGVSTDEAMQGLMSTGMGVKASVSSEKGALGYIAKKTVGFEVSGSAHAKYDRSSSTNDRSHDGDDKGITARESEDFNAAFRQAQNFVKNHHFDNSTSRAANLSNQLGADLRHAEVASKNYDASLTRMQRISQASSYVASQGEQITTNLEQQFPAFVKSQVGAAARDDLFSHPGDASSIKVLQGLSHDFLKQEREGIISKFGHSNSGVETMYQGGVDEIRQKSQAVVENYVAADHDISRDAKPLNLGINEEDRKALDKQVDASLSITRQAVSDGRSTINATVKTREEDVAYGIDVGRENASRSPLSAKRNKNNRNNNQEKK